MTKVKCARCHKDVEIIATDRYGKCLVCSPTQAPAFISTKKELVKK